VGTVGTPICLIFRSVLVSARWAGRAEVASGEHRKAPACGRSELWTGVFAAVLRSGGGDPGDEGEGRQGVGASVVRYRRNVGQEASFCLTRW